MKEVIRARAEELGFDICRFTTAEPPASAGFLTRWLDQSRHGEMSYLARNAPKRTDPQLVLPGAKTVICLAASYFDPQQSSPDSIQPGPHGIVASYARMNDYHEVLGDRLEALTQFVDQTAPEARTLWYVDTGPILERDLAQRAGVGFIGKHTNLISRDFGNWILLGEILTTIEIEPDPAEVNRCGKCTQCIAACPTRAITGPFQLDARLCISYLTIELKGAIPVELRPLVGNRVFGCDDCLAVCPWNRFARKGRLLQESVGTRPDTLDLLELLQLDEVGFRARFRGSPIFRTKRRGLLRNACVALGNIGDPSALPALRKATQDPEPLVGEHADWAINEIEKRHVA